MKPLNYHPDAESEIDSAHDWYLRQSLHAAERFFEELIPALDHIHERPQLYPSYLYGARRALLHDYPYSVVFRERLGDIQIIAVAHAKRRPGYWTERLKQ